MLLLLTNDQNPDIFQSGNILYENIMSSHSKPRQPVANDYVAKFMQYMSEISFRIKSTPPRELLEFAEKAKLIKTMHEKHHIANPIVFYRMGDALSRNRSLTMRELSQEICVPLSTATRIVSLCVDDGLAQRFSDPKDRRIVRVSLTDTGLKIHSAFKSHVSQDIERILGCLTLQEQTTLLTLLGRIADILKNDVRQIPTKHLSKDCLSNNESELKSVH